MCSSLRKPPLPYKNSRCAPEFDLFSAVDVFFGTPSQSSWDSRRGRFLPVKKVILLCAIWKTHTVGAGYPNEEHKQRRGRQIWLTCILRGKLWWNSNLTTFWRFGIQNRGSFFWYDQTVLNFYLSYVYHL